jgi:hypothetical protein
MKKTHFELLDDYIARLPIAQQEEIKAGTERMVEEMRRSQARRYTDPFYLFGFLFNPDNEYVEINWQVSFNKRLLMIYTPFSMPTQIPTIMTLMIGEGDERFKKAGINSPEEINALFEINICHELNEGKKWFEQRWNQTEDRS